MAEIFFKCIDGEGGGYGFVVDPVTGQMYYKGKVGGKHYYGDPNPESEDTVDGVMYQLRSDYDKTNGLYIWIDSEKVALTPKKGG